MGAEIDNIKGKHTKDISTMVLQDKEQQLRLHHISEVNQLLNMKSSFDVNKILEDTDVLKFLDYLQKNTYIEKLFHVRSQNKTYNKSRAVHALNGILQHWCGGSLTTIHCTRKRNKNARTNFYKCQTSFKTINVCTFFRQYNNLTLQDTGTATLSANPTNH